MTSARPGRPGRRQDKRERLIAAACQVTYAQGVEKTTLADIAAAAGIPPGNVYYYFKTKNDLLRAVIETRLAEIGAMLAAIEAAHATPRERLKALFGALADQSALIARQGCPHGSLCQELDKRADGPGLAAELIRIPVDWTAQRWTGKAQQGGGQTQARAGLKLASSRWRLPRLE